MEYKQLGNSQIKVTAISLVHGQLEDGSGEGTDRKEAIAALQVSFNAGVTSIDPAPPFGQGLREEIVGHRKRISATLH